jgi:hypothetical protein
MANAVSAEPASGELSVDEERVVETLRVARRPLGKSEILARARVPEVGWWFTIASLRRRGLVIQEGTRRGARYRLSNAD